MSDRYVDPRAERFNQMLTKTGEKESALEILDLSEPKKISLLLLHKISKLIERAGIKPVKSQTIIPFEEFVNLLKTVAEVEVEKKIIKVSLTLETNNQESKTVTMKGLEGDFYRVYFYYKKQLEHIKLEDRIKD